MLKSLGSSTACLLELSPKKSVHRHNLGGMMNHGVKSLICLVLLTSSSALAGWDARAWPSVNHYRIAVPSQWPKPDNIWGEAIDEDQPFRFITTDPSTNFTENGNYWRNGGFGVDVPQIWAWDTYMALQERYRALEQGTNIWNAREAAMPFKPSFYRDDRANLIAFKAWIEGNLSSFVDQSLASGGTYDDYFSQYTDWQWVTTYTITTNADPCIIPVELRYTITTNRFWEPTSRPESFPMLTRDKLSTIVGLPQQVTMTTNTYTSDVPGWFACQTNVHTVSNHTFTVTNSTISRTWFDYTPYRDFGGWGQGLPNQVSGKWRFELSDYWRAETQVWAIADTVDNPYMARFDPSSNEVGVVTQAIFSLYRHWTVATNNIAITTNKVLVISPCLTNQLSPAITITVTNPAYSVVVSNYSSSVVLFNGLTNIVFSRVYTNAATITNNFAAEFELIAANTTEADYGYKYMRSIMSNLAWTTADSYTGNSTSAANRGIWYGEGCGESQTDSASWDRTSMDTSGYPSGVKDSYEVGAGAQRQPPECTEPPTGGENDCDSYRVAYVLLPEGCYRVEEKYTDISDCSSYYSGPWKMRGSINVSVPTEFLALRGQCGGFESGRCPVEFLVEYRYMPTACELGDVACYERPYIYQYRRNSQSMQFAGTPPGLSATRAFYLSAEHPFYPDLAPDNEAGWSGTLTKTFSQYIASTETGTFNLSDFHSSSKPFASNNLEKRGWQVTGVLELRKWKFGY